MKYSKIIIAIDDGPLADKVVQEGYDFARQLAAEIALLSVVDSAVNMSDGSVTPRDLAEIMRRDFKEAHRLIIDKNLGNNPVRSFVEDGRPAETIIRIAKEWEANAIVIGTHGRTGLSHLLMGSVAENVIRHSAIPVVVIPARKQE